ncbi:MAG: ComF family protein [Treponema sp.]|nr:ComF family protein [Treponema sp.]
MIHHTFSNLRELLFPRTCGGCGTELRGGEDSYLGLCPSCREFLDQLDREESSRVQSHPFRELFTLFPYQGRARTILESYKFEKNLALGRTLTRHLLDKPQLLGLKDYTWVPVPPRPGKIRQEGWDQIEYIVRLLEKDRKEPVSRCLKRLPSKRQKDLNREERESNVLNRIVCIKKPPPVALLLDDVISTGATLHACASALLEGGTEEVYGLCLFVN